MQEALYGDRGFYRSTPPVAHFRTSVHASTLYAGAILTLLDRVDGALGRPHPLDLVDVGAGRGELLRAVAELAGPELCARLRLTGVELADRPADLPAGIGWRADIPALTGLLVANEWLDVVPLDIVEHTPNGLRLVHVGPDGAESLGPPPTGADEDWLRRWWPLHEGDRAEIGCTRDAAWAGAVAAVTAGAALAVDYWHTATGRPPYGSLVGYRDGAVVPPAPDGSCDLTAHVALDSCAAAAGGDWVLTTQREALRELGIAGARPGRELAGADPAAYLRALQHAGEAAELLDPAGLGGFGWLLHGIGMPVPLGAADPAATVDR